MKIPSSFLSFTLLIIFTTTHHTLPTTASDIIYDSTGNSLKKGVAYYILPLLSGSGGGLTLSRSGKDSCPLVVTQELFELNYGIPFTFTSILLDQDVIHSSYPVSIEADVVDPCRGSNILKVSDSNTSAKIVTAGGEYNSPESCFQIVEDDVMPGLKSYQIQQCPFKCGSDSSASFECYNIGIITGDDGNRLFARSDAIFPVVFANSIRKAVESESE